MRNYLLSIAGWVIVFTGCDQPSPSIEEEQATIFSMTTLDEQPDLQNYLGSLSSIGGRAEEIKSDIDLDRIYKIDVQSQDKQTYSAPTLSDPLINVVMIVNKGEYFGYRIVTKPENENWDGDYENFTGEMVFETLDGHYWMEAHLENGQNIARANIDRGRLEGCWNSIDVYYTLSDVDGDGDLDVTHIEFGDSYIECDPWEPSGIPPTPDDDLPTPTGEGPSGNADAGIIGFCPHGYEDLGDGCVEKCAQGFKRNEQGDCAPREKPCNDDPLIQMEISTYNSGKNANRYGCVRTGSTSCDGKKSMVE